MLCNNNRVCWVIFHFIKLLHSKHLSSFLQNFSMRCFRCGKQYTVQKPITRSLDNIFTLESTPSRIFLLSFDFFFFFFFFFTIMFSSSERGLVSEYLVKGIAIFDFVLGHKSLEISLKFSQPRLLTTKQKWLWIYKNLICELRIKKKIWKQSSKHWTLLK